MNLKKISDVNHVIRGLVPRLKKQLAKEFDTTVDRIKVGYGMPGVVTFAICLRDDKTWYTVEYNRRTGERLKEEGKHFWVKFLSDYPYGNERWVMDVVSADTEEEALAKAPEEVRKAYRGNNSEFQILTFEEKEHFYDS